MRAMKTRVSRLETANLSHSAQPRIIVYEAGMNYPETLAKAFVHETVPGAALVVRLNRMSDVDMPPKLVHSL